MFLSLAHAEISLKENLLYVLEVLIIENLISRASQMCVIFAVGKMNSNIAIRKMKFNGNIYNVLVYFGLINILLCGGSDYIILLLLQGKI